MIKVDKYVKGLKVVRGPDWYYSDQDGGAGNVGVVTKLQSSTGYVQVIWSNGRDDNYRIGSDGKYDLALANEADAHLLGHSTSSEPTVESLKAMFPVGTKFIPINETTEYKVYKSWKFDVNSRGDYCFINSNGWYAHNGYLYEKSTGKYAEIITPTETLALPSSIIASKIPKEGAVYIAHFSDTELEALLKVIVSRIGSHHSDKPRTSEHKHLAWTQNGYWYTINTTSKTLYPRSQFFDEPVEATTPEVSTSPKFNVGDKIIITQGDCFYMNQYIGQVATITKVLSNGAVNIDIDKGEWSWYWAYASGHFIPYKEEHVPYKVSDVVKTKSGSEIVISEITWKEPMHYKSDAIANGKTWVYVGTDGSHPIHSQIRGLAPSKETPLEKAKRLFPPGTTFKPVSTSRVILNHEFTVQEDYVLHEITDGTIWFRDPSGYDTHYGYIYEGVSKKWAEIVTECPAPEEPVKQESLKENDIVIFDGPNGPRKYTVSWTCLSLRSGDNDTIFQDLGVDKYQLASKMYGYSVYTGDWPSFNTKDYKAATNLVNELHRLCAEARSSAPTQSNSKTTISYEQEKHPSARSISFQPKSVILQGDDIKISRVQAVRASGVRCSAGEIKCRSGHSY